MYTGTGKPPFPLPKRCSNGDLKLGKKDFDPNKHVRWSSSFKTPGELWDTYKNNLPQLVMVTEGYYGKNEFDVYGSDEVILVTTSSAQPRVVARDLSYEQGHVSIPHDYRVEFEVLDKRGRSDGKPRKIREILQQHKLPVTVRMHQQKDLRFCLSADKDCLARFKDLRLEVEYQERYLLGNRLLPGLIALDYVGVCSIPLYLPIRVARAIGPLDTTIPFYQWEALMKTMKSLTAKCDYSYHEMNKDLMLYNKEDTEGKGNIYELIMPKYMIRQSSYTSKPFPIMHNDDVNARPLPAPPAGIYKKGSKFGISMKRKPIRTLKDIPDDVSKLSVSQVVDCLHLLNMHDLVPKVKEKQIDGILLKSLEPSDLKEEFGISGLLAKKLFMFANQGWRPDVS